MPEIRNHLAEADRAVGAPEDAPRSEGSAPPPPSGDEDTRSGDGRVSARTPALAAAAPELPPRRTAFIGLGLGLVAAGVLFPFDASIAAAFVRAGESLGGDLKRELLAFQQYGGTGSAILLCCIVWALDPPRRRRLLDFGMATLLVGIAVFGLKMLIGRPRPKFNDPMAILGPFGAYPISPEVGVRRAWELGSGISSDLWSMPSSHTAHAVLMSVFLYVLYPRLRGIVVALTVLVALCRPLFSAHWISDVAAGAGIAFCLSWLAVTRYWGVRALDWLWLRFVDQNATPSYPAIALSRGGHGRV